MKCGLKNMYRNLIISQFTERVHNDTKDYVQTDCSDDNEEG